MITVIVDYESGNLRSAEKSFQKVANDLGKGNVIVSNQASDLRSADRIVLPGVGAFASCKAGLKKNPELIEALNTRILKDAIPFLGVCVGMQLMASRGTEFGIVTEGLNWIKGEVVKISPSSPDLKIPHMGWNTLNITSPHPVLNGLSDEDVYFVHSYHMQPDSSEHIVASCDYGSPIVAAVAKDNMIGTQFHPEKSQKAGLQIIENFLNWVP